MIVINKEMRIEYFEGWGGYSHPVKLTNQIDSSQAKKLKAYYVGKFEGDRLMEVTKYLNDTFAYKYEYEYDSECNFIRKK